MQGLPVSTQNLPNGLLLLQYSTHCLFCGAPPSDTVNHQRMLGQFQPLLSFTQLPLLFPTMREICYQLASHTQCPVDSSLVFHLVLHSHMQVVSKTWEMVPLKVVGSCTDYVSSIICHETHLLCCITPPCVKCVNHCIRKIIGSVVLWHIQHL